MKARIKSQLDKAREFQRSEILRYFKILTFVLAQDFGFGAKRIGKVIDLISKYSAELYEDPEKWLQLEEYLASKGLNIFQRESIPDRIEASEAFHKENGKKWRKY